MIKESYYHWGLGLGTGGPMSAIVIFGVSRGKCPGRGWEQVLYFGDTDGGTWLADCSSLWHQWWASLAVWRMKTSSSCEYVVVPQCWTTPTHCTSAAPASVDPLFPVWARVTWAGVAWERRPPCSVAHAQRPTATERDVCLIGRCRTIMGAWLGLVYCCQFHARRHGRS